MKELFKYYYFRVYSYFENGSVIPRIQTFSVIIVFAFINLGAVYDLVAFKCFKTRITYPTFEQANLGFFTPLFIIIPLWAGMWFYFIKMGNHDKIIALFKSETLYQKKLSSALTLCYFILSLSIFFIELWLRQK